MKTAKRDERAPKHRWPGSQLLRCGLALLLAWMASSAVADDLEGQSFGNPNWCKDEVQGWKELDYIPGLVVLSSGAVTGRVVTIVFDHTSKSSAPEIQFLTGFTPSANVIITAGPTLSAPAGMSDWSYTFTVNQLDNNPAQISFWSRLSAGAHLNPSGLIQFSSRSLLIPRPDSAAGSPDLAVARSGPATVSPGSTITCMLNYGNKPGGCLAAGVQITEMLPSQLSYVPGSASAGVVVVGNTLTWDLGNLPSGANGSVSYQTVVNPSATPGQILSDTAMILSAHNDANPTDNTVTSAITVTQACEAPTIVSNPTCATSCAGRPATFLVSATGAAPLGFQWRKNGTAIPGAIQSSYTVTAPSSNDAGTYDAVVTNTCGAAVSSAAVLGIGQTISGGRTLVDGTFQIEILSQTNRQYGVQYSANLINWTNAPAGFTGSGQLVRWVDSGASTNAQRFYRVVLLQ